MNSQTHGSLDEYSAATREALGGAAPAPDDEKTDPRTDSATELRWLLSSMSSESGVAVADIDPRSRLFAYGYASIDMIQIFHRAEVEFDLRPGGLWTIRAMFELTIHELAELIANERAARS